MATFEFYHPVPMIVNDVKTSADQCDATIWKNNLRLHVSPANTSISIPDLNIGDFIEAIKAALIAEIETKCGLWMKSDLFFEEEFSGHNNTLITGLTWNFGKTWAHTTDVPSFICDEITNLEELPVEDIYQIYKKVLSL